MNRTAAILVCVLWLPTVRSCNTECCFSLWFWQFSPLVSQQIGGQNLAIHMMLKGTGEMQRTTSLGSLMHWKPNWKYLFVAVGQEHWGVWTDMAAAGSYPALEEPQLCKATGPSGTICRAHRSASYEPLREISRFQWGKWYSSSCASCGLNVDVHRHMVTVIWHKLERSAPRGWLRFPCDFLFPLVNRHFVHA